MALLWQPGMSLEQVERVAIEMAYSYHRQNKTHTANSLKIAYRTLDEKLKKYKDIDDAEIERVKDERKKQETQRARAIRGLHLEPPVESSKEPDVSMQVGKKVEKVSPPKPTAGNSRSRTDEKTSSGGSRKVEA